MVGYHLFIKRNGDVQIGRLFHIRGAHSKGHNKYSIGICYAGGVDRLGLPDDNRTKEQKDALRATIRTLRHKFPDAVVLGHRDLEGANTACPSFDVRQEYQ
jgi:N-acetyl-anhydromuramyl-L-alanine amidase AmpD